MSEEIRTPEMTEQQRSEQSRIRLEKLNAMVAEGKNPYEITKFDCTHHSAEIAANYDALENQTVVIAGRMMSAVTTSARTFTRISRLMISATLSASRALFSSPSPVKLPSMLRKSPC